MSRGNEQAAWVEDDRRGAVLVCSWRDRGHPDAGGAEVYLDEATRGLAARGWEVTVATASYPGGAADEVVDGVRTVRRGGRLGVYVWAAVAYLRGTFGAPDVIVDVQNGIPFWATLWSRRPVVVLHHHAHREQWRALFGDVIGRIGWWIESVLAPRLQRRARWITVSAASRDDLLSVGVPADRIDVVHNGTRALARDGVTTSATPRLIVLGRLVPHKRVELAIDAVAELVDEFPGLTLDVVGGGEWHDDIVAHAAAAGVADRVTMHGHVDEERKRRLLGAAWVHALPSVKEGWGLVVVEAASLGVPTVAFAEAGGVRGSIRDGTTGLLADDQAEFVAGIRTLLGDSEMRAAMGTAARDHAETFTWTASTDAFATALDRAIRA